MKTTSLIIVNMIITFCYFGNIYSQITIGNIEKRPDTIMLKPVSYDSLNDFKPKSNLIDYRQYVRLQVYLPPFKNPIIGKDPNGKEVLFLFTKKPTLLPINSTLKLLKYSDFSGPTGEFENILTCVYKPLYYFSSACDDCAQIASDAKETGDTYYSIIDVIYGRERIMKFKNKIDSVLWSNIRKHNDKLYVDRSGFKQQWDMSVILKLVNNKTGDTLYSADPYKFILVPYFVKQKQLYDKKIFIALTCIHEEVNKAVDIQTNSQIIIKPLSKWTCEVNLLKNINSYKGYEISYIFRNELNQTFLVDIPRQGSNCLHFILEDEYLAQEKEKQLKSAEQIAQKKKEEQDKIEKERISKQIHYQYCIEKFGQTKGELIAQGKVVIGMTTEMCEVAWGKPIDISKTTTKYASLENWYYGWKYSLYFENGYLIRIEN